MSANAKPLSGALRERRIEAGLSQQGLAERVPCSISMVRLLERGYEPENSVTLQRILEVLGAENEKRLGERRVVLTTSPGGQAQHVES